MELIFLIKYWYIIVIGIGILFAFRYLKTNESLVISGIGISYILYMLGIRKGKEIEKTTLSENEAELRREYEKISNISINRDELTKRLRDKSF